MMFRVTRAVIERWSGPSMKVTRDEKRDIERTFNRVGLREFLCRRMCETIFAFAADVKVSRVDQHFLFLVEKRRKSIATLSQFSKPEMRC